MSLPFFCFFLFYVFIVDMLWRVLLSICYGVFCCRSVVTSFVVDLLQLIVVSSMVNLFMGFHIDNSDNRV